MKGSIVSSAIAEPYAQALMTLAQSQNLTEPFGHECRTLTALLEQSPDLRGLITSPVAKDTEKKAIFRQMMERTANPYFLNFIMLLIDKRRIILLEPICQQYLTLLRKFTNTVLAEVTSAKELNDRQSRDVSEKIKELTGAQGVEIQTKIDPDLIGGVTIKVGSQVFDASLRGQLRRIGFSLGSRA
ncbi:MAG TPA: F0F1 ATP synthase subunit delta [Cyanothece sp. UBA12306]|nr:F0F1 ATP synthase subunit delta [Cyanothece sp. UBA12306]